MVSSFLWPGVAFGLGNTSRRTCICRAEQGPGLVVLGPPGSGKSHLCKQLAERFGIVHVATDDLIKAHLKYHTEIGEQAEKSLAAGGRVPDSLMIQVVKNRIILQDCVDKGYVLDGIPQNIFQEQFLSEAGITFVRIFMLHAKRNVLEKRLHYRRVDPEDGEIYNLLYLPPMSREVTDRLEQQEEDDEEQIMEQLANYGQEVSALWELIGPRSIAINADRSPADVVKEVSLMIEATGVFDGKLIKGDGVESNGTPEQTAEDAESNGTSKGNGARGTVTIAPGAEKAPITLIRCDGYMCERESVQSSDIKFRGAATEQVMLVWNERPRNVLLLVKKSREIMSTMLEAATYLTQVEQLNVVVEQFVQNEALANGMFLESFSNADSLHREIDLVVCLGGDGLILHASTLFKTAVPPLISFNLGSLGFLTPFDFANFADEMQYVLEGSCLMSLRMRLNGRITRGKGNKSGVLFSRPVPKVLNEVVIDRGSSPNGRITRGKGNKSMKDREFQVLNEVVIDRGSSPYLSNLDCFCDEKYITTVQADGIIMSTPTGSTAYSMSAGGSMVHPSVPAILFTPICPHSLSFRPIVFPDAATLRVDVNVESRSHAWASFDGKFRQLLKRGDGLVVQMSLYPIPTINKTDHTGDWFGSLDRAFHFNNRPEQKPLLDKSGNESEIEIAEENTLTDS
eukprot:CAMPEP_0184751924 /NCGR_PEP_ID=MMETSP0315-20130426/43303_1 /TAXON_ID=101924 /ORGANISM="Rhodosorus marinus, Strain UTEX LB 2760" /LENGTH=682 /DNA_ID=CAMNT_0027231225 /DNA_START=343 /DNA_END=2392 /DNA_ORIENTATION=-